MRVVAAAWITRAADGPLTAEREHSTESGSRDEAGLLHRVATCDPQVRRLAMAQHSLMLSTENGYDLHRMKKD